MRIVIVDDNADGANALRFLLEQDGHEIQVARDGRAGLELTQRFRPDIALVDIGLPGVSGYDVAAALRAELDPVVIIAITGGWQHDPARAAAARFDHYVKKPVDFPALQRLIAAARQRAA